MNISLTPELEQMVDDKVKSGRYASASEVIREGLRLLEEQEQLKQQRLSEVRRKIDCGIEQLDRGLGIPGPEARARLRDAQIAELGDLIKTDPTQAMFKYSQFLEKEKAKGEVSTSNYGGSARRRMEELERKRRRP
jgi:antitoxin ParD1/3/4